jgi:photosystem II stability/assembly factor-like uncharacterized protein
MNDEISGYSFGHGFVQSRNVARVISKFDELASYGSASSSLMMWSGRTNKWHHFNIGWTAIRLACSQRRMFALGEETISNLEAGKNRPLLTDMCIIDGSLYVSGGNGAIYKREGSNAWTRQNRDAGDISDDDESGGINAIHGLGESAAFAVGGAGGIWRMKNGKWRRLDSPTRAALNNVRVVEPGLAYAVGEKGLILRGTGDCWETICEQAVKKDLFGIELFNGRVYVACEDEVFAVTPDGKELQNVRIGYGPSRTFRHLHVNDGVMWSFGQKHIFWTADGEKWTNITPSFTVFDPAESGPAPSQSSCGCTGGAHKCG